jgi:hypothetical protein
MMNEVHFPLSAAFYAGERESGGEERLSDLAK